jgi:hypothetical protein
MNAKRDQNFVPVGLGADDTDITQTLPLTVDTASNRLLIEITSVDTSSGTLPTAPAPRDQNFVPVAMAVTDDANETPVPLMIDSRNGLLYVDVEIE